MAQLRISPSPSGPNASIPDESPAPIISTSHGQIRGKTVAFEWGKADAFYGIPYAQPPIGQFRFEKPRPLIGWNGTRDGTKLAPMPFPWVHPQHLDKKAILNEFSEDCLYLNLFRPQFEGNKLKPVLVLIHGGGFQQGSMRRYGNFEEIGRKYLSRGILVAAIEFRLGFLAFASNGQSDFAGNLAYWDQTEALRWLQSNLAAFGGDPKRVTLYGYSSGSMSVGTLTLSPHSRDLFAQSIQMSGPLMVSRAACDQVEVETNKLAQAIGFLPGQNLKEFLKGKMMEELFDGVDKIGSSRTDLNYVKFGPRLDGDFLPANFLTLMAESTPKPTIIGISEMEPLQSLLFGKNRSLHWDAIPLEQFATFGPTHFEEYVRRIIMPKSKEFCDEKEDNFVREMMAFYLDGGKEAKSPDFYLERIVQAMEDLQFVVPLAWEVQARINAGRNDRLFVYINNFVNGRWFPPEVRLHKAFHDNDHGYMFRNPAHANYEFDASDQQIEAQWNEIIANFVHNGNPSTSSLQWLPVSLKGDHQNQPINRHMVMDLPQPILREQFEQQNRLDFWNKMAVKYPGYNLVLGRKLSGDDGQIGNEGARNAAKGGFWLGFFNGRRIVHFKQHLVTTICILLPLFYVIYSQI